jgi:hypothetical protein
LPAGQRATNGRRPRSTSSRSMTPPSSPPAGRLRSRPISATATARGPNAVLSRDVDLSARASLAPGPWLSQMSRTARRCLRNRREPTRETRWVTS